MKIILSCIIVLLGLSAEVAAQQTLKVGYVDINKQFRPLLELIYKEAGLVPEFVELPYERSLRSVDSGEIDADIGRASGTLGAYPNLVETGVSVMDIHLLAVVKSGFKPTQLKLADLPKYRVGFVRGNKMQESVVKALKLNADQANTMPQVMQMLGSGRIDVMLSVSTQPIALFPEHAAGLVTLQDPLQTTKVVHVLNKKWAPLVPKIDGAIKTMVADGRMAKLLAAAQKGP